MIRSGIILLKYWFSVSDAEQERPSRNEMHDPTRSWKLSPMDVESRPRWVEYSRAKNVMFAHCDTKQAPWRVVQGRQQEMRTFELHHPLAPIGSPYQDLTPTPSELPPARRRRRTTSARR